MTHQVCPCPCLPQILMGPEKDEAAGALINWLLASSAAVATSSEQVQPKL